MTTLDSKALEVAVAKAVELFNCPRGDCPICRNNAIELVAAYLAALPPGKK